MEVVEHYFVFMIGFDKCGAIKCKQATVIFGEFKTHIYYIIIMTLIIVH